VPGTIRTQRFEPRWRAALPLRASSCRRRRWAAPPWLAVRHSRLERSGGRTSATRNGRCSGVAVGRPL
jgi:hypothetical protein